MEIAVDDGSSSSSRFESSSINPENVKEKFQSLSISENNNVNEYYPFYFDHYFEDYGPSYLPPSVREMNGYVPSDPSFPIIRKEEKEELEQIGPDVDLRQYYSEADLEYMALPYVGLLRPGFESEFNKTLVPIRFQNKKMMAPLSKLLRPKPRFKRSFKYGYMPTRPTYHSCCPGLGSASAAATAAAADESSSCKGRLRVFLQTALHHYNQTNQSTADFEVVDILAFEFLAKEKDRCWHHVNFRAKLAADPSPKLFFAEVKHNSSEFEVTACCPVDPNDAFTNCEYCAACVIVEDAPCIYHPKSGFYAS